MAGCFQRPYCKAAQGHVQAPMAMQGQTRNHINSWAGLLALIPAKARRRMGYTALWIL